MTEKEAIRKKVLGVRDAQSDETKAAADGEILRRLLSLEEYQKARNVFCYASFGSEVDTWTFMQRALADGKRVALPRVEGKVMKFYYVTDLDYMVKSRFGIYEPDESCGPVESNRIEDESVETSQGMDGTVESNRIAGETKNASLMIMPGVAFDEQRYRIGYGGGYYDKWLESHGESNHSGGYGAVGMMMPIVAVAYELQIVDELPFEPHDRRPAMIITEKRIIR